MSTDTAAPQHTPVAEAPAPAPAATVEPAPVHAPAVVPQGGTRLDVSAGFSLQPATFAEAMEFAQMMAKSALVPKVYQGNPANILVAVQMGAEVGLRAMQALQNIAVINGSPSIWGDAIGALCKTHPLYEWTQEHWDDATQTAICTMKRRGEPPRTQTFGLADAQKAGLMSKDTYKQHLRRMCERRARGRCAQDVYPDALKGLVPAEEAMEYLTGEYTREPPPPPQGSQTAPAQGNAAVRERMRGGKGKEAAGQRTTQGNPAPDSAAQPAEGAQGPADEVPLITREQEADLEALITEVGADRPKVLEWLKVERLADLPAAYYENAVRGLEAKRREQ